ncbi:hypothetical protein TNCT_367351 [Trichonephila clavata]|uniref:Uncharacterized protein n=1 Tax=Trichonephila clavata TaxID=2740835 RepID=A0A8X6GSB3_TRICU|nr:hypothetical protein TNCT_367351 [Trichonephila clavata]
MGVSATLSPNYLTVVEAKSPFITKIDIFRFLSSCGLLMCGVTYSRQKLEQRTQDKTQGNESNLRYCASATPEDSVIVPDKRG